MVKSSDSFYLELSKYFSNMINFELKLDVKVSNNKLFHLII